MKKTFWVINLLLIISIAFTSCKDDSPTVDKEIPQDDSLSISAETLKTNKFVVDAMSSVYYWNKTLPTIDYTKEDDTYKLFDSLLYASFDEDLKRNIDQWSFITDDYQGLLDYFSGVRKSMGHSIRLFRRDEIHLIGFIEYVEPNSPASEAGLERGDMFYKINNQDLTINNYSTLLNQDTYTITFGQLNNDLSISPISPSVSLTSVVLQTNPIHLSKVIEHEGKKIGYLMYKSFIDDYNNELEAIFADFKSQGINDLVLDLRYNGGGAVSTAILLSSMIAPSSAIGDVFINTVYNDVLDEHYRSQYPNEQDLFTSRLQQNSNNLNLDRLVVLTTYKTASASEMVMYGLSPHMTVYHIGEQTHGKYYASATIYDEDEFGNWAMQPIIVREENKDNSIDYRQGLLPDYPRTDFKDASDFYQLGDPREDFLALALEYLTGVKPTGASLKTSSKPFIPTNTEAKINHPLEFDMHISYK